jgi:hypothetical protein
VYFSERKAEEMRGKIERGVLCRTKKSPDDIRDIVIAEVIVINHGTISSDAVLVAR